MARSQKGRAQVAWEVQEDAVTLEKFLRFAESPPTCEGQEPGQVGLTLSGSPSGLRLTGSPEEVRADIEETEERQFVTAQADIRYPAANRTFVFTLNLAHNQLNATFQPVDTDAVEEVFSLLREQFPRGTGPSAEELEQRAQKVAELLEAAEALKRSRAHVGHLEEKAETQVAQIEEGRENVAELLTQVRDEKQAAADAKTATESAQTSADEALETIKRKASSIETIKGEVETSRSNVKALEGKIEAFHDEIEENRKVLSESETRSKAIVTEHEELQGKVDEQLKRAASGALFGAFEGRRGQLNTWKWVWAVGVAVAVAAEVLAILWLTGEADAAGTTNNPFVHPWFLLKIAVTLPILYFIWFAAQQYRKERDREETYAFKSVLSLSLTPYMKVVTDMQEGEAKEKEIELAVATIEKVFDDPLGADKVEVSHMAEGIMKEIRGIIESIGRAGKNLR